MRPRIARARRRDDAARPLARGALGAATVALLAACAPPRAPAPAPAPASPIPPVPLVRGPLDVHVVYPVAGSLVQSRDSNFIFGSIGNGEATLTIDGASVRVAPNGAFLAYLPVPSATGAYELVARAGADSARRVHPVKLPPPRPPLSADGPLVVDTASVTPRGEMTLRADERVRVAVRAPANATAWVQLPARVVTPRARASARERARERARVRAENARRSEAARRPLVNAGAGAPSLRAGQAPPPRMSAGALAPAAPGRRAPDLDSAATDSAARSRGALDSAAALTDSSPTTPPGPTSAGALFTTELPASQFVDRPELVVARGADTIRIPLAQISVFGDSTLLRRGFAQLGGVPDAARDSDRVVVGRPVPGGTYKWFFLPGTVVEVTGRVAGSARVRLDQALEVWVDSQEVVPLPGGYAPARRVVGAARVVPAPGWADVIVSTGERTPYLLTQDGASLVLTLYGTSLSPDIIPMLGNDTLVRQIVWEQAATDRAVMTLRLSRPAYGYRVFWDASRNAMIVRVRRPPVLSRARPLDGLTIVVDAGHPPGGATGPTGLAEAVAVLPVAERVRALLEARGARVVMTRTTAEPVALGERPAIARRADAHAFVSVHLNAFGDGVNPFANAGTSTLFFNQHSEPLARHVQRGLTARLGLRDSGVHYQNLAVARPTWYPAVLCEGAFLMFPEQENAMRDPRYQGLYAEGIVEGLELFFGEMAR